MKSDTSLREAQTRSLHVSPLMCPPQLSLEQLRYASHSWSFLCVFLCEYICCCLGWHLFSPSQLCYMKNKHEEDRAGTADMKVWLSRCQCCMNIQRMKSCSGTLSATCVSLLNASQASSLAVTVCHQPPVGHELPPPWLEEEGKK